MNLKHHIIIGLVSVAAGYYFATSLQPYQPFTYIAGLAIRPNQ